MAESADLAAAAEVRQIDDEGTGDNVAAHLINQLDRRQCGAAGRQQVVDEKNLLPF